MEQNCQCSDHTIEDQKEMVKVIEAVEQYKNTKGALIPVLHVVQHSYGYLPKEVLEYVSEKLNIPMIEIYGVATFYSFFSLEPKGENVIRVCMGTACYIVGAQGILDQICQELKVKVQGTTEDNMFTVDATRCLGACGLAPIITINDKVYGKITKKDVSKILKEYKVKAVAQEVLA